MDDTSFKGYRLESSLLLRCFRKPCEIIVDDILIWGANEEDQDQNLRQVLERAREVNLKLKLRKSQFKTKGLHYVGHLLTEKGLKPDPEKVGAVMEMATLDGQNAVLRFLGIVTYLSKFIPSVIDLSAPLRESIRADVPWPWCDKKQEAFDHIKVIITIAPALKFYVVHKQVTLTCDASSHGL